MQLFAAQKWWIIERESIALAQVVMYDKTLKLLCIQSKVFICSFFVFFFLEEQPVLETSKGFQWI